MRSLAPISISHKLFFIGLCLVQIALTGGASSGKQMGALIVGVLYATLGTFLFAQTVTQALMENI